MSQSTFAQKNNGLKLGFNLSPSIIKLSGNDFINEYHSPAVGFSIGSKGYLGTGDSGPYNKDFWEFDPLINSWTQKADFAGTARSYAVGFSIGAKGLW